MLKNDLVTAYARLSVHEFMLEAVMANWLAELPEDHAERVLKDLRNRGSDTRVADTGDDLVLDQLMRESYEITENLLRKLRDRTAEVRSKLPTSA
ncbi:MAG: hypothetical protein V3S23_07490 [Kiloniellales bacterium]|jgi:hypothetical protein